jgi:hypothetical protein
VDSEIIAALIGVLGAASIAGVPWWISRRQNRDLQLLKISYVKIIHFRRRDEPPVYQALIPRLGSSAPIEVYDEVRLFRLNRYASRRPDARTRDRSSGFVDLLVLHPYRDKLVFSDKGAERVHGYLEQDLIGPLDSVFSVATYYNGLGEGHEDWAIQMECPTREARLIVDASSLPNRESLIRGLPRGYVCHDDREETKGVAEPRPGVYVLEARDLLHGDVLRIDFDLSPSSTPPPHPRDV